jgi:hypothetical protein
MTMDHPDSPICHLCSKPLRPDLVFHEEDGQIAHMRCRSRQLQLEALQQIEVAEAAAARAAKLIDQGIRRRTESPRRITRLPQAPRAVPLLNGGDTLYEVEINAVPWAKWRAAFLRPPPRLVDPRYTPESGRVGISGNAIHFRTTPDQLEAWLYRIDGWIEYANSATGS